MSASTVSPPRYVLPGTWGRIDLASEQASKASIRRLVDTAAGKSDQLVEVRRELRTRFQGAADEARAGGAVELQIAMEISPGVPLSATLAVFLPQIDLEKLDSLGLAELAVVLTGVVTSSTDPTETGLVEELREPEFRAVRQTYLRSTRLNEGDESTPLLQVDYWVAATEPSRLALLTFSSTFVDFEEQLLDLFDAIVATIRWPVAVAE